MATRSLNRLYNSEKNIVHVWYGGNFSPPTNAHIKGSLKIIKLLKEKDPTIDEIVIYWTPSSKNEKDAFIKEVCVSEDNRVEMLKILRNDFMKQYNLKNVKIIINEGSMKTNLPLLLVDGVQIMTKKYKINNTDKIYAVLSQYVVEQALNNEILFSKEILGDYNLLVYPSSEAVAKNKQDAEDLHNEFNKKASLAGFTIKNLSIIPFVVPTKDALKVRAAAKEGNKQLMLDYISEDLANYIILNNIYRDSRCTIQNGGKRRRSRRAAILKRSTRRRR